MFVYHYRIFDRYEERIISLAVLGDKSKEWRPGSYSHEFGGCRLKFDFPVVKLMDYLDRWDELEQDSSPFSIVVRTHLKGIQTHKQPAERLRWKIRLYKALHEEQYTQQDILNLFRFIDWMLALPEVLDLEFKGVITEYEEEKKMAYVTSIERIGIKKGKLQNLQENIAEILSIRFKDIPEQLVKKIRSITDTAFLSELHRKAVLVESVPVFERIIEKHDEAAQDRLAA
ncbi:MAG: cytosolic protein, partial [Gammaproteobacteria bacterium]|nr:cytosolic protein [Gammaproteobacteria bacterium]